MKTVRTTIQTARLALLCLLGVNPVWANDLCPRFILSGPHHVAFKEPERRLLCGDPKNEAWKNIPDNQAIYNLRVFLQDRGFYHPKVEIQGDKIAVDYGEPTEVSACTVRGHAPDLPYDRLRKIVGERLTPNLLDTIKHRIHRLLQSNAYPCPSVEMQANPDTGEVFATIEPGPHQNLIRVDTEKIEDLDERIFQRYYAFRLGGPYNSDFLDTTVRRILDEGMVQSNFFLTRCEADGAVAQQRFIAGPPRLFTAGIGVDTERLLFFRTSWKNSRLGEMGSIIHLVLSASFRDQEFDATSQWYVLPEPSRYYLRPAFSIRHDNLGPTDHPSETLTSKVQLAPAMTWDTQDVGGSGYIGPTFNLTHTIQGPGPKFAKFLSLGSEWRVTDHYYEFFRSSPRTGFEVRLEANFTQKEVLSNFSAYLFRLTFEKLWNVFRLDPPLFVVGLRGALSTTLTDESVSRSSTLTPEFRHFYGGSSNLRGFGLKELPGDANGALTGAYLGVEFRFADLLPAGLQPFTFVDFGAMGRSPFTLDRPYFWSPGAGLRWETSFGVLRSTLAHGYLVHNEVRAPEKLSHWQFYFSFGEEF